MVHCVDNPDKHILQFQILRSSVNGNGLHINQLKSECIDRVTSSAHQTKAHKTSTSVTVFLSQLL